MQRAPQGAAVPFFLVRQHDVVGKEITTTTEIVHGLLRLEAERLVVQWRVTRQTQQIGREIRTDQQLEAVRELALPLASVAGAVLRRPWWPFARNLTLVVTAADLRAFESLAGDAGLRLGHPAQLVLQVARSDADAAREFAGELQLALAERALAAAQSPSLADPPQPPRLR